MKKTREREKKKKKRQSRLRLEWPAHRQERRRDSRSIKLGEWRWQEVGKWEVRYSQEHVNKKKRKRNSRRKKNGSWW